MKNSLKVIILTVLIIINIYSILYSKDSETIKFHLTKENWSSEGRCYVINTFLIEAKKGNKIYPDPRFRRSIYAIYYTIEKFNDSSVLIKLDKSFIVDNEYKRNNSFSDTMNANYVYIGLQDIKFYMDSDDAGTNYYLRIDTTTSFYKIIDTGDYPRITNVTEKDDPKSWVKKRETTDSLYIIKWEEIYNDNWCFIKHGTYTKVNNKNLIIELIEYKNGVKDGKYELYYENGNKKEIGEYKKNLKHGEWSYWDEDGNQIAYGKFKNGIGKTWYMNNQIHSEENYNSNLKINTWKSWYENGMMKYYRTIKDNGRESLKIEWYSNGQKKIEKLFIDSLNMYLIKNWHENGFMASVGNKKYNNKTGIWKYWDSEGILIKKEEF